MNLTSFGRTTARDAAGTWDVAGSVDSVASDTILAAIGNTPLARLRALTPATAPSCW